jgi:RTX calcium-binding nonapeptide repeat (4 copies)/Putative metal-binding motif
LPFSRLIEEDGQPMVRCFLVALLAALLLAPAAHGAIVVTYVPVDVRHDAEISLREDAAAPAADEVTITQNGLSYEIRRTGGGLTPAPTAPCTGDVNAITCPLVPSISIDLGEGDDKLLTSGVTGPLAIAGGNGNDTLLGGAADDVLAGGAGNDTLNGGAGNDAYFGETGDDTITSRDGIPERIACGGGTDTVDNDFTDIIAECERGTDNDRDGFSTAVDCNDANASIFPGAPDPEDGIDQDCDGKDNRNLDRDGDGFPVPADCDDGNPAIRPNAAEVRGNGVDENCDRRAEPFATLPSLVSTSWRIGKRSSRLRKLVVRNATAGARVRVACHGPGCTLRKPKTVIVRRNLAPVFVQGFLGKATFRPGARLTVAVTATGAIGRTYTYRIKRGVLPIAAISCRAPGAKKGRAC